MIHYLDLLFLQLSCWAERFVNSQKHASKRVTKEVQATLISSWSENGCLYIDSTVGLEHFTLVHPFAKWTVGFPLVCSKWMYPQETILTTQKYQKIPSLAWFFSQGGTIKKLTSSVSKLWCAPWALNNLNEVKIAQSTHRATLPIAGEKRRIFHFTDNILI